LVLAWTKKEDKIKDGKLNPIHEEEEELNEEEGEQEKDVHVYFK
jgi:hypothetical protein